ncbi:hypothetical protein [Frankia sp. CcWB2]
MFPVSTYRRLEYLEELGSGMPDPGPDTRSGFSELEEALWEGLGARTEAARLDRALDGLLGALAAAQATLRDELQIMDDDAPWQRATADLDQAEERLRHLTAAEASWHSVLEAIWAERIPPVRDALAADFAAAAQALALAGIAPTGFAAADGAEPGAEIERLRAAAVECTRTLATAADQARRAVAVIARNAYETLAAHTGTASPAGGSVDGSRHLPPTNADTLGIEAGSLVDAADIPVPDTDEIVRAAREQRVTLRERMKIVAGAVTRNTPPAQIASLLVRFVMGRGMATAFGGPVSSFGAESSSSGGPFQSLNTVIELGTAFQDAFQDVRTQLDQRRAASTRAVQELRRSLHDQVVTATRSALETFDVGAAHARLRVEQQFADLLGAELDALGATRRRLRESHAATGQARDERRAVLIDRLAVGQHLLDRVDALAVR